MFASASDRMRIAAVYPVPMELAFADRMIFQ
jgi:hypothetical protein